MEKKFDGNYTRMLRAILDKSWMQQPTKQQPKDHLPPITKTIQGRRTRHAGHCWRSGDELISDVLLWTPSHGQAKAGWPARTYILQLGADTGCSLKDQTGAMDDWDWWRERVKEIRAGRATWWWCIYINMYIYRHCLILFNKTCLIKQEPIYTVKKKRRYIYIYIYIYTYIYMYACVFSWTGWFGLVCLVLWHINLCRLFNAKSIFM